MKNSMSFMSYLLLEEFSLVGIILLLRRTGFWFSVKIETAESYSTNHQTDRGLDIFD